jgi:hypothetical protein
MESELFWLDKASALYLHDRCCIEVVAGEHDPYEDPTLWQHRLAFVQGLTFHLHETWGGIPSPQSFDQLSVCLHSCGFD